MMEHKGTKYMETERLILGVSSVPISSYMEGDFRQL